jgi:hypothetical protein
MTGWDHVPWIVEQVAASWRFHNPTWNLELVTMQNLDRYVHIPYISKNISMQAKSDIIRLYLLDFHGGVWADATMICMTSLDSWVYEAISLNGFWMYHGGAKSQYPASWFMVSSKNSTIIHTWRIMCDQYWETRSKPHNYFWMDFLFNKRIRSDPSFMKEWNTVPYISCENGFSAHVFRNNIIKTMDSSTFKALKENPPFAIKLSKANFPLAINESNVQLWQNTRGYVTVQLAKEQRSTNHTFLYSDDASIAVKELQLRSNKSLTIDCLNRKVERRWVNNLQNFSLVRDSCDFCKHLATKEVTCIPVVHQ